MQLFIDTGNANLNVKGDFGHIESCLIMYKTGQCKLDDKFLNIDMTYGYKLLRNLNKNKAIFYSIEFEDKFKFVEIGTKIYQEYINEGISCCETKFPTNLFLFFSAEGVTINSVKNYEDFKQECFKYYGDDEFTECKKENYIDVHFNDDGQYGRFEY